MNSDGTISPTGRVVGHARNQDALESMHYSLGVQIEKRNAAIDQYRRLGFSVVVAPPDLVPTIEAILALARTVDP